VTCTADPLVGFDQAAFDAQFGASSFILADYFGFVFSEGLAPVTPPAVPEPSMLLLLATGLAICALMSRRRAVRA
jgi:hypothetical protein